MPSNMLADFIADMLAGNKLCRFPWWVRWVL